jgi:AcrR family transcriptional regulator
MSLKKSAQPAPDSTRRSERSRRAIYDAALTLVAEVGYPKTTIEGIAARAGVGKQTIYRWWSSKADVLLEAFLDLSEQASRDAGPEYEFAIPDTGDLAADLKLVLRATVEELNDPRFDAPMRALSTEIMHDPELAALYARRLDGPLREMKRERLRSAQRAGELAADLDLEVAVDLIWAPVAHRWSQRGPLTAGYADAVIDTALAGLRGRRG